MGHYFLVDTPAVAALAVDWRRTCSLRPAETDAETVVGEFAASMAATGQMSEIDATNAAWEAIQPPDGERGDAAALEAFLVTAKGVRPADAGKVVRALGDGDGRVEYLARGEYDEGIRLTALRYGDNFCIPVECRSFDYASPWFRSEWLTREQLLERVETDGWDARWVEETLRHPGADFYNSRAVDAQSCEDYRDLYNICWCYTAETNDAGETVRRVCVLSHADGSAFGRRALSTRRGKRNAVLFRREVVSTRLLAGRGLAEICSADQGIVKTLSDRSNDNAIIGSLPPTVTKGTQARNAVIQPFGRIPVGTADDVRFMTPPQFPATAKDRAKEIRDALLDYLGVSNGETDVSGRTKAFVADFLRQVRDLFVLMVETAQDCASDELLAGVTDDGDVRGLKREDVTGRFGLKLTLDPGNLDAEKLMKKLTTFSQVIGMDRRGEIDTAPVMRHALFALFPEVSKRSLKSSDQLTADDLSDEQSNFVKIKAGVMPQMNTDGGWNYAARLGWWERLQQENPEAVGEMFPASQEMMARWSEALRQQDTQYGQNAEGHNYRYRHATRTLTRFYEAASMQPDEVKLVVEYLRDQEIAAGEGISILNRPIDFGDGWKAKDAWYQTAPGERFANTDSTKVRVYQILFQAPEDADADGPYAVENGCAYKSTNEFYWDVETLPTLPDAESGVEYSMRGVTRDRETGLFSCVVERRERIRQDVAEYLAAKTVFEKRSVEQHVGVKAKDVASAGKAASAGDGTLVTRRITKNADCTSDVTNETTEETAVEGAVVETRKTISGTTKTTLDRNQATAADTSKLAVGESVRVEKTPGGLYNNTKTTTEASNATLQTTCERSAGVHTDVTVKNEDEAKADCIEKPSANVVKRTSSRLNENGTYDSETRTTIYEPDSKAAKGGSANAATETTVSTNQTEAPESGASSVNVEERVSISLNEHGSMTVNKTKTTYTPATATATTKWATETATTTTTRHDTNTSATPSGTYGSSSASPDDNGAATTSETSVTPIPVDSGWITWESTTVTSRGTYHYKHGLRVFCNAETPPTPPSGSNCSLNVHINKFGRYDGSMSYTDLDSWEESSSGSGDEGGSSSGTVNFYLFRQTAEGKTQKRLVTLPARSYHGSGNYASESSAAANATIVAGLKLPARTYGTGTPTFGSWENAK